MTINQSTALRPDAEITSERFDITFNGGPTNAAACTNDDLDSTFISDGGGPDTANFQVSLGTFTVPTGAQIRSVSVRVRISGSTSQVLAMGLVDGVTGDGIIGSFSTVTGDGTTHTVTGPSHTTGPSGSWTQADIDNLRVRIFGVVGGTIPNIYEIAAIVEWNEAPNSTRTTDDGQTTSGSPIITSPKTLFRRPALGSGTDVGRSITGAGIPAGTTIASIKATTIASGSNGVALPTATINVADASTFAASGRIEIDTSAGRQVVTYTGKTATTFTGCTGGTGNMSTGNVVQQPTMSANASATATGVAITTGTINWITAPTEGQVLHTSGQVSVRWTFYDPDVDTQERYRVKIFTLLATTLPSFDPDTTTATWDSGEVLSSAQQATSDTIPANSYVVYVKVGDSGSGGRYSPWDNNAFSLAIDVPNAPTLSLGLGFERIIAIVTGYGNLAPQGISAEGPGLDLNNSGNPHFTKISNVANLTMNTDSRAEHGQDVITVQATSTGGVTFDSDALPQIVVPVNPGDDWAARCAFRALSNPRTCTLTVTFKTAAGASVGSSATATVLTESTTAWARTGATFNSAALALPVPATARFMVLRFGTQASVANENHIIDSVQVTRNGADTGFQPGGFVAGPNLLSEAQASATTQDGWSNKSNATVQRKANLGFDSGPCWSMTAVAAADMSMQTPPTLPVTPDRFHTFMGWGKPVTTTRQMRFDIFWFKADGSASSTASTTGTAFQPSIAGGWSFMCCVAIAPSDAAYARVVVNVLSPAAGEEHRFHLFGFWEGVSDMWVPAGELHEWFALDRSQDDQVTWDEVEDEEWNFDLGDHTERLVIDDYEAPRGGALWYRARMFAKVSRIDAVNATTEVGDLASPYTIAGPITLESDGNMILRSVEHPELVSRLCVTGTQVESVSTESQSEFQPIGRRNPVVNVDTVHGQRFHITVYFDEDDDWESFKTLRAAQEVMLFKTCYGDRNFEDPSPQEQYYVRFGPEHRTVRLSTNFLADTQYRQHRTVSFDLIEVDRP